MADDVYVLISSGCLDGVQVFAVLAEAVQAAKDIHQQFSEDEGDYTQWNDVDSDGIVFQCSVEDVFDIVIMKAQINGDMVGY